MTQYLYNARDIAAYFKWAGVPPDREKNYLSFLYDRRDLLIARPMTVEYDFLEKEVFREMYYLWSAGYVNEYSDVGLIVPDGGVSIICDQEFIRLEAYMKLVALHLILTANLPYVRMNFVGLPLVLGISGEYADFERNLTIAFQSLRLVAADIHGNEFEIEKGIPDEILCISISNDLKDALFGKDGSRRRSDPDWSEQLRLLKQKSLREKEIRDRRQKRSEEKNESVEGKETKTRKGGKKYP
ncbi:MAG: hypothetical protein GXY43_07730 [Clostridiaceae bacterium]|nr:hypothetical protein [Clostridiaceae bacterium]